MTVNSFPEKVIVEVRPIPDDQPGGNKILHSKDSDHVPSSWFGPVAFDRPFRSQPMSMMIAVMPNRENTVVFITPVSGFPCLYGPVVRSIFVF